jgi:hypothetical protein
MTETASLPPAARVWLELAIRSMNACASGARDEATRLADLAHEIAAEFPDEVGRAKASLEMHS